MTDGGLARLSSTRAGAEATSGACRTQGAGPGGMSHHAAGRPLAGSPAAAMLPAGSPGVLLAIGCQGCNGAIACAGGQGQGRGKAFGASGTSSP